MSAWIVLTVIGPDRPGLVEALSQTVAEHDANWLESRMSHLAGQFAGLLRVSVPRARAAALSRALGSLESQGLRVVVQESIADELTAELRSLELDLIGQDRPGIIRDVSRALAQRGVNVEELVTCCTSAPMSGETLFQATARLRLPLDASLEELRATLERIANELMVDLNIAEPE